MNEVTQVVNIDTSILESQITTALQKIDDFQKEIDKSYNLLLKEKLSKLVLELKGQQTALEQIKRYETNKKTIMNFDKNQNKNERKLFQFICNFLLAVPPLDKYKAIHQNIMKMMGEFMYDEGPNLFDDEQSSSVYPLLFLILAGVPDDDTYKQKCYLKFLPNEKRFAYEINLSSYCEQNPNKFMALFHSLMDPKNPFNIQLKYLIDNGHKESQLELAKLHLFASKADQKIHNYNTNAETYSKEAKTQFLKLMHSNDEAKSFLEKYFPDDFDYLVQCSIKSLKKHAGSKSGRKLLQRANQQFTNVIKTSYTENEILFAYYLGRDSETSKVSKDAEKAATILYHAGKVNATAIDYLKRLVYVSAKNGFINPDLALLLGKLLINEIHNLAEGLSWLEEAARKGNLEANYQLYLHCTDIEKLKIAAEGGYEPALNKLQELADSNIPEINANYILGLMHVNGKGVEQNFTLAKNCFVKIAHVTKSKLQLISMVLSDQIKADEINLLSFFKEMGDTSDEICSAVKNIINAKNIAIELRYELASALARFYFEGAAKDYELAAFLASFCFEINPENYQLLIDGFIIPDFALHLDSAVIAKLFKQFSILNSFDEKKLHKITIDFLARNHMALNELLLTCSQLRKQLSTDEILQVLTNAQYQVSNIRIVILSMTTLINESNDPKLVLEWLTKNELVLISMLKSPVALQVLSDNKTWQQFIKTKKVCEILKKENLFGNKYSNSLTLFKNKENETKVLIKHVEINYAKRKEQICTILCHRLKVLIAHDKKSEKVIKLQNALSKMNQATDLIALEHFVENLTEIDEFFSALQPQNSYEFKLL